MGIKKDIRVTWRALEKKGAEKAVVRRGEERGTIGWSDWGRVLEEKRARRGLFCLSFEKRAQSFQNFQLFSIFVMRIAEYAVCFDGI